ncbi:hypothetical protein [uncultured Jannaschia sp.]|nr:hypothetical protein [uncultured Jannaschia sp.]
MMKQILRLVLFSGIAKLLGGKAARNIRQVDRVAKMARRMRR